MKRDDGRINNQMRSIKVALNKFGYGAGSVFLEVGNTKLICSVTMNPGVPTFLRGKKTGWLSAEYDMLPCATQIRTLRAVNNGGRYNGRAVEISRLIGRAMRTVVNTDMFPDRTITIDCDVLQADGGTRTAAICGAYLALMVAQNKWLKSQLIEQPFLIDTLAAVSVGIMNGECVLDPSYKEDSAGQADFNFVISKSGGIIEMQGGAEKNPVAWDLFEAARICAIEGANQWFELFDKQLPKMQSDCPTVVESPKVFHADQKQTDHAERAPFFSLKNRLKQD